MLYLTLESSCPRARGEWSLRIDPPAPELAELDQAVGIRIDHCEFERQYLVRRILSERIEHYSKFRFIDETIRIPVELHEESDEMVVIHCVVSHGLQQHPRNKLRIDRSNCAVVTRVYTE
jgi:hypothetical protein